MSLPPGLSNLILDVSCTPSTTLTSVVSALHEGHGARHCRSRLHIGTTNAFTERYHWHQVQFMQVCKTRLSGPDHQQVDLGCLLLFTINASMARHKSV